MNLGTLRLEAQRLAARVDQDFNTRTRRWLNEALRQWAISVPWPNLRREEDFTSLGTRQMIMPQRVLQVQWVADKTNQYPMDASDFFDREFPAALLGGTTGAARFWREMGTEAVAQQPVVGTLSVRTDVSDVFSVFVEGLVENTAASGTPDRFTIAREAISVSSSGVHAGTKIWQRIDTIGKDDLTPADVVVRDSSSNVISTIHSFAYRAEYRRVEFVNIPVSGTIFTVRYLRAPTPLVNDTDIPHTSVEDEYLIWYSAAMIHESQGQAEQAQIKLKRAEEILNRRIYKEKTHGDRDYRMLPEPGYWSNEDQYLVPEN